MGYKSDDSDIQELGKSICEQEYKQNFKSYSTSRGLECVVKQKEDVIKYDGIKVRLGRGYE